MSAFIVSDTLISRILGSYAALRRRAGDDLPAAEAQAMGQTLLAANYASVNACYHENRQGVFALDREAFIRPASYVQALRYCDCLPHQSGQFPGWEPSEARALLDTIRTALRTRLPKNVWRSEAYCTAAWR